MKHMVTPTKIRVDSEMEAKAIIMKRLSSRNEDGQKIGDILFTVYQEEMNVIVRLLAKELLKNNKYQEAIETTITGMEWKSTEEPLTFDKADWEHLGNLKELIKPSSTGE